VANLTITLGAAALRRARLRAASEGRSVNAVLKQVLEDYAGLRRERKTALADLISLSRSSQSLRGHRQWPRADLHERN
jgi:hypothetical protein